MKTIIIKTMTAAAMISGAALTSLPAAAMGFKNCTGEQIRIKIYNNKDVAKISANPLGNGTIGINGSRSFKVGEKLKQVKVFRSRVGKDTEVLLVGGLNGGHKFSVRKNGKRYSISKANDCAKTAGKPPKPVATIAVNAGRWIGGKPKITIGNVSGNSFTLKSKGKKGNATYTLVANNTYRGSDGKTFVMQASGQATWDGVAYRHKG